MAEKRYYITESDYEFFVRVFPELERLNWSQPEESIETYRHINIDFDKISETDVKKLGEDHYTCLQRLKRQLRITPPSDVKYYDNQKNRKLTRLIPLATIIGTVVTIIMIYNAKITIEPERVKAVAEGDKIAEVGIVADITSEADSIYIAAKSDAVNNTTQKIKHPVPARNNIATGEPESINVAFEPVDIASNPDIAAIVSESELNHDIATATNTESEGFETGSKYSKADMIKPDAESNDSAYILAGDVYNYGYTYETQDVKTIKSQTYDAKTAGLLRECQEHFISNRLTIGYKGNALDCYRKVIDKDPENTEAHEGLQKIETKYIQWAIKALHRRKLKKVRKNLKRISKVNPESTKLAELEQEIQKLKRKRATMKKVARESPTASKKRYSTEELTKMSIGIDF